MNYERAVSIVAKYNYEHHDHPIIVIPTTLYFTNIPLTVAKFIVRGDVTREGFTSFEDAVKHRDKIMKKK